MPLSQIADGALLSWRLFLWLSRDIASRRKVTIDTTLLKKEKQLRVYLHVYDLYIYWYIKYLVLRCIHLSHGLKLFGELAGTVVGAIAALSMTKLTEVEKKKGHCHHNRCFYIILIFLWYRIYQGKCPEGKPWTQLSTAVTRMISTIDVHEKGRSSMATHAASLEHLNVCASDADACQISACDPHHQQLGKPCFFGGGLWQTLTNMKRMFQPCCFETFKQTW